MDNNEVLNGVSRRTAIKSVAAGGALVWAAPAITSVGSAFGQQTSPNPVCPGERWSCGEEPTFCGPDGFPTCFCDRTTEGATFCWDTGVFCDALTVCTTSADCPAGSACFPSTCCLTAVCIPACGTVESVSTTGGTRPSGL